MADVRRGGVILVHGAINAETGAITGVTALAAPTLVTDGAALPNLDSRPSRWRIDIRLVDGQSETASGPASVYVYLPAAKTETPEGGTVPGNIPAGWQKIDQLAPNDNNTLGQYPIPTSQVTEIPARATRIAVAMPNDPFATARVVYAEPIHEIERGIW